MIDIWQSGGRIAEKMTRNIPTLYLVSAFTVENLVQRQRRRNISELGSLTSKMEID